MILYNVSIGSLRLEDADTDGFHLKTEDGSVWVSYEQFDDLVPLLATLRKVNGDATAAERKDS